MRSFSLSTTRYIASLLPFHPVLTFVPGGGAPHIAYDVRTRRAVAPPPRRACFGAAVQVEPSYSSGAGSQEFYAEARRHPNPFHPHQSRTTLFNRKPLAHIGTPFTP